MSNISIIKEGDRWLFQFKFDWQTVAIVKAAGARFDGSRKLWWTTDPAVHARLAQGAGVAADAINAERHAEQARKEEVIQASRASASDAVIPLSDACRRKGYDYLPYQKAGIAFALPRSSVLIADEMGLGKTMQALGLINADDSIRNVLIVVPASIKRNWEREALLWLARKMPVQIVNGTLPQGGVCIINYEQVAKHRAWIDSIAWDMLVCDESHYMKNPKAQRTIAVLGRWDKESSKRVRPIQARRRVMMTGTPILNRPVELWPILQALDPTGLGRNWKTFVTSYCNGHQKVTPGRFGRLIWDVMGSSRLPELQARLRSTIMVRRLKSEVLTELPAKRRQIIALRAESAAERAALKAEAEALPDHVKALRAEVERLSVDEASDAYKAACEALLSAGTVAFEDTARVRHEVALAKLPQCVEHIRDVLEGGDGKLIVFGWHHDVIDGLVEALGDYGVIRADGRDSTDSRDASVRRFQTDPAVRVIVCSIGAMNMGHTLTASSHVVFCELCYVPGLLQQAEDRAHRIGQQDSVLVQHLVLDGSLDCRMAEILVRKMEVARLALDANEALPEVRTLAQPPAPKPEVPAMPDDQRAAVHEALRLLAARCDGARALDGAGFNKFDSDFGKSLAAAGHLSDTQAAWGKRLVWKYQRQLGPDLFRRVKGE
jgi:SWI/SNF-related matrix-associated actin-dependent regulator 1 of chromatin subfamily A